MTNFVTENALMQKVYKIRAGQIALKNTARQYWNSHKPAIRGLLNDTYDHLMRKEGLPETKRPLEVLLYPFRGNNPDFAYEVVEEIQNSDYQCSYGCLTLNKIDRRNKHYRDLVVRVGVTLDIPGYYGSDSIEAVDEIIKKIADRSKQGPRFSIISEYSTLRVAKSIKELKGALA